MRDYYVLMNPDTKQLIWSSTLLSDIANYRDSYCTGGHIYKVRIHFEQLTEWWKNSHEVDAEKAWKRACLVAHSFEDLDGSLA